MVNNLNVSCRIDEIVTSANRLDEIVGFYFSYRIDEVVVTSANRIDEVVVLTKLKQVTRNLETGQVQYSVIAENNICTCFLLIANFKTFYLGTKLSF